MYDVGDWITKIDFPTVILKLFSRNFDIPVRFSLNIESIGNHLQLDLLDFDKVKFSLLSV